MRFRSALLLAGMVVAVAACGENAGLDTTTTVIPASTEVDEATSTAPTTTEAVLADLTGEWDNGTLVLMVNDAGEYVLNRSGEPGETLTGGFVARDGDQFNFVTGTTGSCPGQTGVYRATITDEELTLTLVEDPCLERAAGLQEPLSRMTD